jgi:hypothetical protein
MSELATFHDVRFPTAISFGATGGPERRNQIVQLTSGREKRNARFAQSRHHYTPAPGSGRWPIFTTSSPSSRRGAVRCMPSVSAIRST